ncbi:MAG: ABC transporter ATP-binding protein [Acidaminococcaceae bacterium]|nr:ABC transporter ATP-binding protein [Acidaminococcaceae bacterium]MDD4722901.1 ABC transporter ATP-binding protein [Acidaminococcaceae bacterium]
MKEMVRLEGIKKKFGDNLIIPNIDLTIADGEFLTLLGPSGCGKTTLLRMIAGLEEPTCGKIFLDNEDVTTCAPYKRDVNMVFQNYALFPHMNVEENIRFGLMMKRVSKEEQQERLEQVLYLMQLEDFRTRRPQQMSGGQQQRVAIARALINNPKVLLLDEPLGALDYQLRKNLQLELKNLQRGLGLTFVYVTHDQEEALTMSDRIVVMNAGRIEQDSTPDKIYHNPSSKFVARFIGESNFFFIDEQNVLVIRPEKLNICEEEEKNAKHPLPSYYGTVVDIVFYGTIDKVFIRLDNSNQTVIAYQYFDDVKRWHADERVGIWWYPQDGVSVKS